jgi:hypothetical protein
MITKEEIKELEKIGEVKRIIVDGKEEIYLRRFCGNGPDWWQKISEPPSINAEDELNKIIHLESNSYLLGQKTLQEVVEGIIEGINAIVNKVLEQSD